MQVEILPLDNLLALGLTAEQLTPAYGGESAGLDLYNAGPDIVLHPAISYDHAFAQEDKLHGTDNTKQFFKTLMPTGIKIRIPRGYVGIISERGSITKSVFKVRAGIVDNGYSGQVFVNFINTSSAVATLKAGEKSPFQIIVVPVANQFKLVDEQTYSALTEFDKRRQGQIGSSDIVIAQHIDTVNM